MKLDQGPQRAAQHQNEEQDAEERPNREPREPKHAEHGYILSDGRGCPPGSGREARKSPSITLEVDLPPAQ